MEKYNVIGMVMLIVGAALAAYSYFIVLSIPLTAAGIGVMVIGASLAMTPVNPVPTKAIRLLLENSVANIEALLEEVGAAAKAYYTPVKGHVYAYVPLGRGGAEPPKPAEPPKSVIAELGDKRYLVVVPPAANLVEPGGDLEGAVSEALVDLTEFCDSVRIARSEGITVELRNPRAHVGAGRFRSVMGSLEASIAATAAALTLGRTVVVESEAESRKVKVVRLKVL